MGRDRRAGPLHSHLPPDRAWGTGNAAVKSLRRLGVLLAVVSLAVGWARPASAELLEKTGTFDGLRVTYKVVLPDGYDSSKTYPLVLVFTGGPQTLQIATMTDEADWRKEARRRGY